MIKEISVSVIMSAFGVVGASVAGFTWFDSRYVKADTHQQDISLVRQDIQSVRAGLDAHLLTIQAGHATFMLEYLGNELVNETEKTSPNYGRIQDIQQKLVTWEKRQENYDRKLLDIKHR